MLYWWRREVLEGMGVRKCNEELKRERTNRRPAAKNLNPPGIGHRQAVSGVKVRKKGIGDWS